MALELVQKFTAYSNYYSSLPNNARQWFIIFLITVDTKDYNIL